MQNPKITPKYKDAIEWIANEDEPSEMSVKNMADLISVLMIADLFKVDATDVANDVIEFRRHG